MRPGTGVPHVTRGPSFPFPGTFIRGSPEAFPFCIPGSDRPSVTRRHKPSITGIFSFQYHFLPPLRSVEGKLTPPIQKKWSSASPRSQPDPIPRSGRFNIPFDFRDPLFFAYQSGCQHVFCCTTFSLSFPLLLPLKKTYSF